MVRAVTTPPTRPCPGGCGRDVPRGEVFGCLSCNGKLPHDLRYRIWATWWATDWANHARALSDALLYLAHHR